MLRTVAVLIFDDVAAFELGVLCEVFGSDRTADGFPGYCFDVCTVDGRPVRTRSGFMITPTADLTPLDNADLVAVPAHPMDTDPPEVAAEALRRAAARGAYVLSVCSGAFLLGAAGLLDGRILTSAGTAAGIDLCLYLVRHEHGSAIATALARRMVVPPHRDGGQAQYVEAPVPKTEDAPTLEPLLSWLVTRLDREHTVEALAARAHMSPRTFARRFKAETGATPHDWLTGQRVLLARRLLEESDLGMDAIAVRCGFGTAAMLRHHFTRRVGATPAAYRTTFRDRAA